jgi:hypothetical protein
MVLSAWSFVHVFQSPVSCVFSLVVSPPQVAEVARIAGWDHLHHGAFVGTACDEDVRGSTSTENASWTSASC